LFNRMNRKLKQVAVRASRASKSLFEGSSSSNSRREAMLRCVHIELKDRLIAFQRSDDEEEEERGDEEGCGEEERPNEEDENEDAVEVERVMRQTWRSHMVAPPIAPAHEEDRVLIKPLGDR
jgi:hypothetical protein